MKFKDLPEGHYYITDVNYKTNMAFVERLENPEEMPRYVIELDTIHVVHDGRSYNDKGSFFPKHLDKMDADFKSFAEVKKERKSRGGRFSHITRLINANEPLTGKKLEFVLDIIGDGLGDGPLDNIAKKLKAGLPLDEYEQHYMVDSVLVHARLG